MNAVHPLIEAPKDAARRLFAREIAAGAKPEALHLYTDADDKPLFYVARLRKADGDKIVRPMVLDGAQYKLGRGDKPPAGWPLYRLPELLADPAAVVWIVEGEACADALAKAGKVATTSGSASSASGADWTPLQGRSVRLWPDHDEPGRKYADAVEPALRALGCTVERVDVAALGLIAGGDVVDWLGAGGGDLDALPLVAEPAVRLESGSGLPTP